MAGQPRTAEPGPETVPGVEMDGGQAFDAAGTRVGIEGLVGVAEAAAVGQVRRAAREFLPAADVDRFAGMAAWDKDAKSALVTAGVEVARKHGVSIGPEVTLVLALGKIGLGQAAILRELAQLQAKLRPAQPADVSPAPTA